MTEPEHEPETLRPEVTESGVRARAQRPRRGRDPRGQPLYGAYRRFRELALGDALPRDAEALGHQLLHALLETRGEDSPILGARLFRRHDGRFELIEKGGAAGPVEAGYSVPADHPAIVEALREGWVLVRRSDPRFDAWIERTAGDHALAKLTFGAPHEVLLSVTLREPLATSEVLNALAALHSLAESALERLQIRQHLEQARAVQTSLLPRQLPAVAGLELAVRSRPAEIVGGDVYDFATPSPETLGFCVADATGHGLPAALQARDAIIGLRMGLGQQIRMVATIEKLSQVIAGASPGGRYVSLFYGELDRDGHLVYINAGHPLPLIVGTMRQRLTRLRTSGPILGLEGRAARPWTRLFQRLESGDLLVVYTDGVTEAHRENGEEFGVERLIDAVRRQPLAPLEEVADAVLAEAERFAEGRPQLDDQTLLLVRRR